MISWGSWTPMDSPNLASAYPARQFLRRLLADKLRQHFGGGAGIRHFLGCPFGIVVANAFGIGFGFLKVGRSMLGLWLAASVADVQDMHPVSLDGEQDAVYVRLASVKQVPHLKRKILILRR